MGAPTMETEMKEEIRKSYGFRKTKDVFAFDDGLSSWTAGPLYHSCKANALSVDAPGFTWI